MKAENSGSREDLTKALIALQHQTSVQPYSITHRLELAKAYRSLGYPDLAIGDAYKALLLIDEVVEEGDYHDEAFQAARSDHLTDKMARTAIGIETGDTQIDDDELVIWTQTHWLRNAYVSWCIPHDCDCLRTALDFISRAKKAHPDDLTLKDLGETLTKRIHSESVDKEEVVDADEYRDRGLVRREQYPWNHHEPDRFSDECLHFLNEELAGIAPKLEVKASSLPVLTSSSSTKQTPLQVSTVKQLGLFAKQDIFPGEQILEEKSLLTAISRLHDAYCDACSVLLPGSQNPTAPEAADSSIMACEECDEVFFCSSDCHDRAQESYHSSLCGVNVEQGKIPAREAADHLYTLLLVRALALAETQDIHPLELKEVRYIWGDYHGQDLDTVWQPNTSGEPVSPFGAVPRTLPFSFKSNILMPLHVLEKMDVNIFSQSPRYDTWVFNTLYAKFRGTASARQGLDGRPETSAVHPLWCLANHSCDPNVAWEWRGTMRFWTREKLVDWEGRNSDIEPGLKTGDEVFGHYCDVRLPVRERREWAVGALGGDCMCTRCVWEAAKEEQARVPK